MENKYDFSGWATRNNVRCSDGRIIMKDAFKDCDGTIVPLVWNHRHNEPDCVLGHALLENREEGVYTYCSFNDTETGINGKKLVTHGDVCALSIYANQLKEQSKNVIHGVIREVSLVLAGANPEAFIDSVIVHSDGSLEEDYEQGIIYTGEPLELYHSEDDDFDEEIEYDDESNESDEEIEHTDESDDTNKKKTIQDVFDTFTPEQLVVMTAILDEAINNNEEESEEDKDMKHNVFEGKDTEVTETVLSHSDQQKILAMAKNSNVGSFKTALENYLNDGDSLSHTDNGIANISQLFPEYKDVRPGAPEMLTTDQGWITYVLNKVHKSPISRIRTRQADIRDISNLRAKGYVKQGEKGYVGNISLLYRTTDPQTVYVKSKLDRDDIVDITDFDVVSYMYGIDRMNLNEELATAIMLGDGREEGADGKIDPTKIRPIWLDDELYTIHATVDTATLAETLQGTGTAVSFGENYIYAEAIIQSLLYARENYKGSANPDFFCTPHLLNVMLLARDLNGRRIYDNVNELRAALNVGNIITVEQFANKTRTVTENGSSVTKKLLGIMANLGDYSLGATKGGEITHFTDFDIDFNQEKSLLETRCSGANTRVKSVIVLEENVVDPT